MSKCTNVQIVYCIFFSSHDFTIKVLYSSYCIVICKKCPNEQMYIFFNRIFFVRDNPRIFLVKNKLLISVHFGCNCFYSSIISPWSVCTSKS